MPTPSGHTRAILCSKVVGTTIYDAAGNEIGHVEDIVLDKMSDDIMFAIVGFGGFLGIGEMYHALPWSLLDYEERIGGYVVRLTREELERAPSYDKRELTKNDGAVTQNSREYYARWQRTAL